MKYLNWKEEKIGNFEEKNIIDKYNNGFIFTRLSKGIMQQTRSIRIDLNKFELTSENRRILRKADNAGNINIEKDSGKISKIEMIEYKIPYPKYSWEIGKMAKDFYDKKADNAFSANKIKELITTERNFNTLISFNNSLSNSINSDPKVPNLGYAICYKNSEIIHYCYPFYDLEKSPKDMGLIMMTKTIEWAKNNKLKYVYLGSLQRPNDIYKLQFEGIEWFDGKKWSSDLEEVKEILKR